MIFSLKCDSYFMYESFFCIQEGSLLKVYVPIKKQVYDELNYISKIISQINGELMCSFHKKLWSIVGLSIPKVIDDILFVDLEIEEYCQQDYANNEYNLDLLLIDGKTLLNLDFNGYSYEINSVADYGDWVYDSEERVYINSRGVLRDAYDLNQLYLLD